MNLYLDIDGVLVGKGHEPVEGVVDFLERVVERYDCFWLTSYCKDGNAERALRLLEKVYGRAILAAAEKIQPTQWLNFKTEAIDFYQDFRWVDDYVMLYEEVILKNEKAFEKLIVIDLEKNPNQLKELVL